VCEETVEVDHGLLGSHRYLGQNKTSGCESSEEKGSEGRQSKTSEESSEEASEEAAAEASEEVHSVARSEVTTTVGGLTKEDIRTMFKDIVDAMRDGFGTCLKEIKYLSERMEAVEKKVGITTKRKGTSAQNTTPPPKPTLEPGCESVNGTNAGRKSLPEDKGPDVPADASSSKDKAPEPSFVLLDKNQSTVSDLQKEDLGRRLPGGAWNYYAGTIPSFCQSNKVWGRDIDDIYAPVNYTDIHWIAMWILIPKRHMKKDN
ncbi:unnamed protein product, partial [Brassica oleracea]